MPAEMLATKKEKGCCKQVMEGQPPHTTNAQEEDGLAEAGPRGLLMRTLHHGGAGGPGARPGAMAKETDWERKTTNRTPPVGVPGAPDPTPVCFVLLCLLCCLSSGARCLSRGHPGARPGRGQEPRGVPASRLCPCPCYAIPALRSLARSLESDRFFLLAELLLLPATGYTDPPRYFVGGVHPLCWLPHHHHICLLPSPPPFLYACLLSLLPLSLPLRLALTFKIA